MDDYISSIADMIVSRFVVAVVAAVEVLFSTA